MIQEEIKLFKEFEDKFGFRAYNELTYIFARLNSKIEDVLKSRDNWRNKYEKLSRELKNANTTHSRKEVNK